MKLFENNYRSRFKLTSDQVFYWVYGMDTEESKRALIALLNVVLDRKDDPIIEVGLLNPVQKGFVIGDKPTVMDIKCETSSGELIDVEMQNGRLPFYPERSLFYGGKKWVNSALEEGEDYDKMKKKHSHLLCGQGTLSRHTGHPYEVPGQRGRYRPSADRQACHALCGTGQSFGRQAGGGTGSLGEVCSLHEILQRPADGGLCEPAVGQRGEEAVQMSEHVYKKVTESDLAREMLEREEKAAHDIATMKVHARREGLAEGRAEGRTEGRAEGRMEGRAEGIVTGVQQMKQALGLSAKGKTPEEIATELNLSIEIVRDMLDLEAVIE